MEYHEAATFLFDLRRFRPKPGTASTADLLSTLGNPHEQLTCIQVAGSNGKGSTVRLTESILRSAGLDVGRYTSPHFDDVRERITVNGRAISRTAICEFVEEIRPRVIERAADNDAPTFFEVLTAMALWEFDRRDVDIAVLEVGIGGPQDATSVIDPVASAVTSVTLEHTDLLGSTESAIATDKAQVAPRHNPLVTAARGPALEAIRETVDAVVSVGEAEENPDIVVRSEGRNSRFRQSVTIEGPTWTASTTLPLLGRFQARNAGVAAALASQVAPVERATIEAGLARAEWPGRTEVIDQSPLTILDGAHNPGACAELTRVLDDFDYQSLILVIGAMHDKDHVAMARELPQPDRVIACQPSHERAEDEAVLARVYDRRSVHSVTSAPSVSDGLERAIEHAGPDDCVLVTGSLYVVAEARARWARVRIPKRIDSRSDAIDVVRQANVPPVERETGADTISRHVVKTLVSPRQARKLLELMTLAGGRCLTSGLVAQDEEPIDVVLTGSKASFRELQESVVDDGNGLALLADDLMDLINHDTRGGSVKNRPWEHGPCVMGILNVTPDSFHDGGRYQDPDDALTRAEAMINAGAAIVDVGGESTRPGAEPVPVADEIDRVVPVIERVTEMIDVPVSIDTRKPAVARAALDAGATMINDVTGLEDPAMRAVAADADVPVVLMHSIDAPVVPDRVVDYDDVVEDVIGDLTERLLLAVRAGVARENIIVDPGIGFGKQPVENFELLERLGELRALGQPIMVGHSYKSMFDHIGRGINDRRAATVAVSALAVARGADIIRVHDVADNIAAIDAARPQ